VIVGPTFFSIPIEEGFFFVIQTYITCLIYLLFSTPVLKPAYLVGTRGTDGRLLAKLRARRAVGQIIIFATICIGAVQIWTNGKGTYLGLILAWAGPFTLLLWTLAYQFLGNLPSINVLAPIIIPTLYLWGVDTLALKRGTWSIESGTKLGIYLWDGLEIEESVFFLATNVLIVFGLVAFENAMAILEAFPALFPDAPALPSPILLIQALLTSPANFDDDRIKGIQESVDRLKKKSRSFYLASSVFQGRLRIDLILL
jgi:15-cis-phytoene synthase/lycopene beta-cyclase